MSRVMLAYCMAIRLATRDLTRRSGFAKLPGMSERYDIKPNPDGGWLVIDTGNRNIEVSKHKTHGEALREAIRRG